MRVVAAVVVVAAVGVFVVCAVAVLGVMIGVLVIVVVGIVVAVALTVAVVAVPAVPPRQSLSFPYSSGPGRYRYLACRGKTRALRERRKLPISVLRLPTSPKVTLLGRLR